MPASLMAQRTRQARAAVSPATGSASATRRTDNSSSLEDITALLQAGRLEEAEALARRAVVQSPRDANARTLLGIILDKSGRATEAEREYRDALRLNPNFVPTRANLGVLLARTGRTDEAIQNFEAVLRVAPEHAQAVFNLGALYAARADYKRAIPLLERAANINSQTPNTKAPNADVSLLLTLVNAYAHDGRGARANELADSIERNASDDPRILFSLGLSLAEAREYKRAALLFERTNALRPNTYEVLYNLGVALYNLDQLDDAMQALQTATTLSPNEAEPYYRLGLIVSARGDSKTALTLWLKALELRPAFAEANFMIGEELFKKKAFENSVQYYEQAARQDTTKLLYHVRLGVAHFRSQQYPAARAAFALALKHFPDNPTLYYLTGYAARAEGLYDEAIVSFNRSLALQPDNADVITNLGFIASQRGESKEAERLLRKAISLDPNNFPAHHDLGRLLVKLKRFDEATPVLERGVLLNKSDAGIHYQLFTAYSRLKRRADAERALAKFKEIEADSKHAATPLGGATNATANAATPPGEESALPELPASVADEAIKNQSRLPRKP